MTRTEAKIDENSRNTLTGWNETTGQVEDMRVEPITGALLVFGVSPDSNTPTTYNRAGIDANGRNTLSAWNATTSIVESLRCGTDGSLLVTQ